MNGTVILSQFSFGGAEPTVDGSCQIPWIVDGITFYDARVSTLGPFMFLDLGGGGGQAPINAQIVVFYLPSNATAAEEASATAVAARTARGSAAPPPSSRRFVPNPLAGGDGASNEHVRDFLASIPMCGHVNISQFADYAGSWLLRFDEGALPTPTALTFSEGDPSSVTVTAYDVLSGGVLWSTPAMPIDNNGVTDWEYAWASWRNHSLVFSGNHDYRLGSDWVAAGDPLAWAAAPSAATLATLMPNPHAEGTSSFTGSFPSSGPTPPFPVLVQQITDNSFSCKPSGDVDSIVGFSIDDAQGNWTALPTSSLITCPAFAPAMFCITPLVVAWQPVGL